LRLRLAAAGLLAQSAGHFHRENVPAPEATANRPSPGHVGGTIPSAQSPAASIGKNLRRRL